MMSQSRILLSGILAVVGLCGVSVCNIVVNEFHYKPEDDTSLEEFIELYNSSEVTLDLSGWSLSGAVKYTFPESTYLAGGAYLVAGQDPAVLLSRYGVTALGPWSGKLSSGGERIEVRDAEGLLQDQVEYQAGFPWPTGADGGGASAELMHPELDNGLGGSWRSSRSEVGPTPGEHNSVYLDASLIPPHIGSVNHAPMQPAPGELVVVTARITDTDGVGVVMLAYQLVEPGSYIRLTDAAYSDVWTNVAMTDDGAGGDAVAGDSVYTVTLSAALQTNRRLVRYRITCADVLGNTQTVPYADDEQANFAYYVYAGLPDWQGAFNPGSTQLVTYPASLLGEIPVYTLIADGEDVINSQYNPEYNDVRFRGTLVIRGEVYDHIEFRNRGEVSTYVSGKNKWRFYFNRSRRLQAFDNFDQPYAEKWKSLSANAGASPWAAVHRGMAGVEEALSFKLHHLAGVPSPHTHFYHFRVVRGTEETGLAGTLTHDAIGRADGQYTGDFWGLYLAVEPMGGSFLDERGLPDGNIYEIEGDKGDKKNQAPGQPLDSLDWDDFFTTITDSDPSSEWWKANMDMENYYTFHALNRLTGNIDLRGSDNHFFFHRADDNRWVVMPWDLDMMFIPKRHWTTLISGNEYTGVVHAHKAIVQFPEFALQYRNRAREILDLMASDSSPTGGQIGQLIAEFAGLVHAEGEAATWANADAAMWNMHPRTEGNVGNHSGISNHKGNFFRTPYTDYRNGGAWVRRLRSPGFTGYAGFEDLMQYLLDYTTDTWPGGQWYPNNGNQLGYGYQYLLSEARDASIPQRPVASYTGAENFPRDDLIFSSSAFDDPQGAQTFAAMQWRLAEISAPGLPGYVQGEAPKYEIETIWASGILTEPSEVMHVPANVVVPGKTYRLRVRHQDDTGRWSHWSLPIEFTPADGSNGPHPDLFDKLVISEIHYHPLPPETVEELAASGDKNDFEFVEVMNIGSAPIDLTGVGFTRGIDFTFADNTLLQPGASIAVAQKLAAFTARYGEGVAVAGEFDGRLDNAGERLTLSFAGTVILRDFSYSDDAPWPTDPDGGGPSLVLREPHLNRDHGNPASWMASTTAGGTPGMHEWENLLFANLIGASAVTENWYLSSWFGLFAAPDEHIEWIWHEGYGWMYCAYAVNEKSLHLWVAEPGMWIYTQMEWFPYLWIYGTGWDRYVLPSE